MNKNWKESDLRPVLARRLEQLRLHYDMNHVEFSKTCGVGRTRIMLWRTLRAGPQVGGLYRIADAFGVSIDWLLGAEDVAKERAMPLSESERQTLARILSRTRPRR